MFWFSATGHHSKSQINNSRMGTSQWWSLTEHAEADFLASLSSLVAGDALVISFINLLDVLDGQLRSIFIQTVLLIGFQHDITTAGDGVWGKEKMCLLFGLGAVTRSAKPWIHDAPSPSTPVNAQREHVPAREVDSSFCTARFLLLSRWSGRRQKAKICFVLTLLSLSQ